MDARVVWKKPSRCSILVNCGEDLFDGKSHLVDQHLGCFGKLVVILWPLSNNPSHRKPRNRSRTRRKVEDSVDDVDKLIKMTVNQI